MVVVAGAVYVAVTVFSAIRPRLLKAATRQARASSAAD
jgi:hypothetical protein